MKITENSGHTIVHRAEVVHQVEVVAVRLLIAVFQTVPEVIHEKHSDLSHLAGNFVYFYASVFIGTASFFLLNCFSEIEIQKIVMNRRKEELCVNRLRLFSYFSSR